MSRHELLDEIDLPFPLGGCFGYWGYDLKNFVEPKLPRTAVNDLELPDCHVGFYDSVVVFDHRLSKTWIISTGLQADGSRVEAQARQRVEWWFEQIKRHADCRPAKQHVSQPALQSNLTREEFISKVRHAQDYIRRGHLYQVNLSQRLGADWESSSMGIVPRFARSLPCSIFGLSRLRRFSNLLVLARTVFAAQWKSYSDATDQRHASAFSGFRSAMRTNLRIANQR